MPSLWPLARRVRPRLVPHADGRVLIRVWSIVEEGTPEGGGEKGAQEAGHRCSREVDGEKEDQVVVSECSFLGKAGETMVNTWTPWESGGWSKDRSDRFNNSTAGFTSVHHAWSGIHVHVRLWMNEGMKNQV
jgi:hypothetical protein